MSTVQIIKHQPEDQNAKCSQPRNCNNKLKFAFGSIVILILVAMVATVCAVVVVFSLSRSGKALPDQTTQLTITGLEEKAKMLDKVCYKTSLSTSIITKCSCSWLAVTKLRKNVFLEEQKEEKAVDRD